MSVEATNAVWKHSTMKGNRKLVLLALADYANDDWKSWPSVETLARKCGTSVRSVQEIAKSIEASGELRVHHGAGIHGVNVYEILVGRGAESAGVQNLRGAESRRVSAPKLSGTINNRTEANASAADAGGEPGSHTMPAVVDSSADDAGTVKPRRKGKPKPGTDPRVRPLLLALADIRGYPVTEWAAEGAAAKRGLAVYEPDAILGCARHLAVDPFWQDKPLTMASVVKQTGAFSKAHTVATVYDDRGNAVLR